MTGRSQFWAGLTTPSPIAVGVAVLIVLGMFAAFLKVANPDALSPWTTSAQSDATWATMLVSDAPGRGVAILGGSTTRESVDQPALATALGPETPLLNLTVAQQTFVDSLGLAAALPADTKLIIIGVTPGRISTSEKVTREFYDQPRFGFLSEEMDKEYEEAFGWASQSTGWLPLDRRAFYLHHFTLLPRHLAKGRMTGPRVTNRYRGRKKSKKPRVFSAIDDKLELWHATNLGILGRMIASIRARGQDAVILDGPIDRRWAGTEDEAAHFRRYDEILDAFAEEHSVEVWRMEEVNLMEPEFHDRMHLSSVEAQQRYSKALARRIRERMGSRP